MILYVNGDSNSAGADLVDRSQSWPQLLADRLGFTLINESKSGASNPGIMRVTSDAIAHSDKNTLVMIGWTSWEREEWFHQNQYYNVNSGGHDTLPTELQEQYKEWITKQNPASQAAKSLQMHSQIHRLHRSLIDRRIPHLFFNALMPFQHNLLDPNQLDWHKNYIGPYDNDLSYYWYLKNHGQKPNKNNHYGKDAQGIWADVLYNHIKEKELV